MKRTLATTAESVALLQPVAHTVLSQLLIGSTIDAVPFPTSKEIKEPGLKQEEASGFAATAVRALVQLVESLKFSVQLALPVRRCR